LSDFWPHGEVADTYGVLRSEGKSERAIFIIDREGVIRYIDIHDIDSQPDNEVLFTELSRIDPRGADILLCQSKEAQEELPHGGIVMYCTPWCPDCKRARAWLNAHHLSYREVNIDANFKAAAQVRAWANGSQTTPTFDIDGMIVVDFKEDRLREILKVTD
jgi:glutaredoxin